MEIASINGPLVQVWIPVAVDPHEVGKALIAWKYGLSKGQVETLEWLSRGLTNSQLAERLGLQEEKSVRNRIQAVLDKMKVRNRIEAVAIAVGYGLVKSLDP